MSNASAQMVLWKLLKEKEKAKTVRSLLLAEDAEELLGSGQQISKCHRIAEIPVVICHKPTYLHVWQ